MDDTTSITQLKNMVREYCDARDWDQFHDPKDLAIGVATEAAELLEHFRFRDDAESKARVVAAERAARHFSTDHVGMLLKDLPLAAVAISTAHPLPLRRLVFHYKMGFPSLGRRRLARRSLASAERLMAKIIPRSRWEHVVATARKQK